MRTWKAHIATYGTAGVQVAGALILLAVVSGLLVFTGWFGDAGEGDRGNLIVGGPERIAREAAPAAGAVAERPAAGSRARALSSAPTTASPATGGAASGTAGVTVEGGDGEDPPDPPDPPTLHDRARVGPAPPAAHCSVSLPVEGVLRCPVELLTGTPALRRLITGLDETTAQLTATTAGVKATSSALTAGAAQLLGQLDPRPGQAVAHTAGQLCVGECVAGPEKR